ncbi:MULTISPECIES: type II secretion system F family protein [Vibrio]|uniref:Type II secretion system F family protein n=1 Tax=Vibrio casei TaxID=673372 RepID=A0A368LFK9_9VIBR|nr:MULTISPECIES: type II secretion system F family protein [Vibrio]RCS68357.1 type II secretion system F family protein [Vibrio casei]SJN22768.1 Flp pilus assembly protein TadC [Vibrio casei]HBV77722.1 type II secretion system protein [Vibrio sp.]
MGTEFFFWLAASFLLLALSAFLWMQSLTVTTLEAQQAQAVKAQNLKARSKMRSEERKEKWLQKGQKLWGRVKQQNQQRLTDMVSTMRQAGYISSREQTVCLFKVLLAWIVISAVFFGQQFFSEQTATHGVLSFIIFVCFLLWMTLRWFRYKAKSRAKKMDDEILITVHLMSILWQVGLSLESLLRAYHQEAEELTPELNKEIGLILARIDTGQNREQVFNDMASRTLSIGFQDLLTMMSQAGDSGGGLKSAFQSLAKILQDRKRTDLQEKVTKMSGKISVIMMVFMFPALFIVLGGPAALALKTALGD